MTPAAVATALRVLGTAVAAGAVVDRPSVLDVYGARIAPREVHWIAEGMTGADLGPIPGARGPEDMQLTGAVAGRTVRVLLVSRVHAGLIGDLAQALAARTVRAKAGAR